MNNSAIDKQRSNVDPVVSHENYIVFVDDLDTAEIDPTATATWETTELPHHPTGNSQRPGLIRTPQTKLATLGILGLSLAALSLIAWLC